MKNKLYLFAALLVLLVGFFACNKQDVDPPPEPDPDYDINQGAHIVAPDLTTVLQYRNNIVMYELTMQPGDTLPWHEHPPHTYYVLEEGTLEVIFEDSTTTSFYPKGKANFGSPSREMAINTGQTTIKILIHDFYYLDPIPDEPTYEDDQGAHIVAPSLTEILHDNRGIVMYELTMDPGDALPWHEHPPHTFYIIEEGTLEVVFENNTSKTEFYPQGRTNFGLTLKDRAVNVGQSTIKILMHEFYSLE